jgi:hypothetical protein
MLGDKSSDLKLKPLLIYHSQTPEAMRGYSKEYLPVIWRSDPKAKTKKDIFY